MRTWAFLMGAAAALWTGGSVFGDGMMIAPVASPADISEPEQKAVVWYHDGVEDLILSVSYGGAPKEFCWVVPVPSQPEVDKVGGALFHELSELTDVRVAMAGGEGMAGAMMEGTDEEVVVLERKVVGVYDVAVLAASGEGALVDWLHESGYAFPDEGQDVLAHFVDRDWVFVAARIAPEKADLAGGLASGEVAPLRLTFECDEPVYPLKISSLNRGATEVLLYIAAEKRAQAEGFSEEYSRHCDVERAGRPPEDTELGGMYPTFAEFFAGHAFVLTKIRRVFTPAEMTSDVLFTWAKRSPERHETFINGQPPKRYHEPIGSSARRQWRRATRDIPVEARLALGMLAILLVGALAGSVITIAIVRRARRRNAPPPAA